MRYAAWTCRRDTRQDAGKQMFFSDKTSVLQAEVVINPNFNERLKRDVLSVQCYGMRDTPQSGGLLKTLSDRP